MKISLFPAAAAHALSIARVALLCLTFIPAAGAAPESAGNLSVIDAWSRATPPGVPVGGAYFTIANRSKHSDTLVSLSSPAATRVELHRTTVENGLSRMRPTGQIVIAPGETVKAEPGGLHVMLMGLRSPLTAGMRVPLVLTFQHAGPITVQLEVQSIGSAAPARNPARAAH